MSRHLLSLPLLLSLVLSCGPNSGDDDDATGSDVTDDDDATDDDDSSDDDDTAAPPVGCLVLETAVTNDLGESTASFMAGQEVHLVATLTNTCETMETFTTTSGCFWGSWALTEQVGGEPIELGCDDAITDWILGPGQATTDEQLFGNLASGIWVWDVTFGDSQWESWKFDVLEVPG